MTLYSWGANSYGQLSLGIQSELCASPTEIKISSAIEEIVALAAGGGHTLVLDSVGHVFGSGSNNNGQLANLDNNIPVLSRLEALEEFNFIQIECGWESSYAITDSGFVLAWGSNKHGQLGVPKTKVMITKCPVFMETPNVMQLSAGLRHTAVVTREGHVYTCGQANKGQLGILCNGKLPTTDIDCLVRVEGLENVKQVACGQHHTLALTCDGRLYGWGDNRRGQLGEMQEKTILPTPELLTICDLGSVIRAGWTHSAVLSGGGVSTWGRNNYSQLGHSCGQDQVNILQQLTNLTAVKQIELGSEHCLALTENGQVFSWGWNEHGNCGTGNTNNVPVPQIVPIPTPVQLIAAGAGHSIALSKH